MILFGFRLRHCIDRNFTFIRLLIQNRSIVAKQCDTTGDCFFDYSFTWCQDGYCQPSRCTATGQCVHGHQCSETSLFKQCQEGSDDGQFPKGIN